MKRLLTCLLLAAALVTNVCALEVPTDTTIQNLNGSQQLIKTYTLPPGADPRQLVEEPFELEGWHYTFADIVKEENQVSDRKYDTETVTLETDTKDLGKILEQLAATLDYDDGTYSGVLNLDHTAIRTEAAGYTSQARNVSVTKTIGPLDRNDMSYVPATTVKDGVTLSLSGVDWQVIGTDLVGDDLAPASYQAVATYSGKSYHRVATGYITSANYVGEVSRNDVESVTYKVTYLGTESGSSTPVPERGSIRAAGLPGKVFPYALGVLAAGTVAVLGVLLFRSRRTLRQLQEEDLEDETEEEPK
ncbi:hypothetical protein [uncultured Oscillibacter sp.]|uniref:hypothetical protein n=1 Tax=uncultured Oscillibacter sp. TaxID=876091 RepID=UPI00272B7DFF|nr:hypothetical protein [uncultured Oscillibacter sp.]